MLRVRLRLAEAELFRVSFVVFMEEFHATCVFVDPVYHELVLRILGYLVWPHVALSFLFEAKGGDERPLLIINILKRKRTKSLYKQDSRYKERKKIKLSRKIIQCCLSILLSILYCLASHGAKAVSSILNLTLHDKRDTS